MSTRDLSINAIRVLSAEAIQKANSGHPGLPLGAAPMAYTLWADMMNFDPADPAWPNRDRFVLSAGHGSMLMYSLLHIFGYEVSMEDIKNFRQRNSRTPGHPELGVTPGVEISTGPLGQGIANAVGMAIAEAQLAARFNKPGLPIVNHRTYALCGDGCMMEGLSYEAASLAGTLALSKLTVIYDSNNITIEGDTDGTFREDVAARFASQGWDVYTVEDGNDCDAIKDALDKAASQDKHPSLIIVKTQIGYGCPAKQGSASSHGAPLGADNVAATRANLGWDYEPFTIPQEVYDYAATKAQRGVKAHDLWSKRMAIYETKYPEDFAAWQMAMDPEAAAKALAADPDYAVKEDGAMATRAACGKLLQKLAKNMPNLVGGSADLASSNNTVMKGCGTFSDEDRLGRNILFGIREHAMGAICNGIQAHGGFRTFASTFFVFSDYMKHSVRMSALMQLPVLYIFSHDSIGVGEDGPTHQPVEHLAQFRSMPGVITFRPADYTETMHGMAMAVESTDTPYVLVTSRQNLPVLDSSSAECRKGAYALKDCDGEPELIIISSGAEVAPSLDAWNILNAEGIKVRLVSMPSMELFDKQSKEYRDSVLPASCSKRLVVEAGTSFGWHKYAGMDGQFVTVDTFGASAPANQLFAEFGFTGESIAAKAKAML
ncbi:MAG: transketolase [Clostridia bacterium]|nr:transketolase [Clostridia bacterium]